MNKKSECECQAAPKLIFPCSGAADVGAISDLAGRSLTKKGWGKMFCLAGIGGRVSGILESTKATSKILVIDGCPLDCAKLTLENAGFTEFDQIKVTDLGMEKGKTPLSDENITLVVNEAKKKLDMLE